MTTKNSLTGLGYPSWTWPFTLPGSFAPNPGWSFGNVTINSSNSTSPETEQGIVSQVSYGRQLGRMMDAMVSMVNRMHGIEDDPAVKDFIELAAEVQAIKARFTDSRLEALRKELKDLRESNPKAWKDLFK